MRFGKVRTGELKTLTEAVSATPTREVVSKGMVGALTVACWALWIYLILPLVSLLLWVSGVRTLARELPSGGYSALAHTLVSYSLVLVILVSLLGFWIWWNVARYSGANDRRTLKRPEATHTNVWRSFQVDESIGQAIRDARSIRVDLDSAGCLVVLEDASPAAAHRGATSTEALPG